MRIMTRRGFLTCGKLPSSAKSSGTIRPTYSTPPERLEHFHKLCSVFSAKKEALAVVDGDGLEGRFGGQEQIGFRSRIVTAEDLLDLAPHRFDGIEVGRIGRQIKQPGARDR